MTEEEKRKILEEYSFGKSGTRDTIEKINGRDFADLIIALAQYNFPLPKSQPEGRESHIANATKILAPLLQNHA